LSWQGAEAPIYKAKLSYFSPLGLIWTLGV
jgi:hypothetical protein